MLVNVMKSRVCWYTRPAFPTSLWGTVLFGGGVVVLQGIVGEQNDDAVGRVGVVLAIDIDKLLKERKHQEGAKGMQPCTANQYC